MRIILCDNGLPSLVRFRYDVINHYLQKGHEVLLLYPGCTDGDEWRRQIPKGSRFIPVNFNPYSTNPIKDFGYFIKLLKIYKKERPDLCIHYTIKPNIYGTIAAKLCRIKTIAMVAGLGYMFTGNSITKVLGRLLYKMGLRLSNHVITLNTTIRDLLVDQGFVNKQNITLLKGGEGVNLQRYPLFIQKYDTPTRFLTVARVLYDKGYAEYANAADIVHNKYPAVEFEWLGDYDKQNPMTVPQDVLDKDVAEGRIHYLGVTDNVLQYLRRDGICICLPSFYPEGLSKSLMEACSIGLPIIASDIPGCSEAVDEGINGYLVPKKDAEALATAMIRFLELSKEEKQKMAYASYEKAVRTFDVQLVLDEYDRILVERLGITI